MRNARRPSARPSCASTRASTSIPCSARWSRAPRALTGARFGAIATVDEAGVPHKGIVLSGFTADEQGELLAWPGSRVRCSSTCAACRDRCASPTSRATSAQLGIEPAPTFSRSFQGTHDAPPRRRGRPLLPRREGGRGGVQRRRRRGAHPVRLAGGFRDRQRAHPPRRAARTGRPRGARRDLAGGRGGVRCAERAGGVGQPRGAAHRGAPAHTRPPARAGPGGADLPPRRRQPR